MEINNPKKDPQIGNQEIIHPSTWSRLQLSKQPNLELKLARLPVILERKSDNIQTTCISTFTTSEYRVETTHILLQSSYQETELTIKQIQRN